MFGVRFNLSALEAVKNLNSHVGQAEESTEHLSAGKRITRAADDVAGFGVATRMRALLQGHAQAVRNISDGVNLALTADGGLATIESPTLARMRELLLQAANGTLSDSDRASIDQELSQLKDSINDTANHTEFNGRHLLNVPKVAPKPQVVSVPVSDVQEVHGTGGAAANKLMDVVWLVDGSGSMSPYQQQLGANATAFSQKLADAGIDARLAVVGFCDLPGVVGGSDWTTDVSEFSARVTSVGDTWGDATTENGMGALDYALNQLTFRPGAGKAFVLLTNEDADDEAQLPQTLAQLKAAGVTVYGIMQKDATTAEYDGPGGVITQTGGIAGDIGTPDWSNLLGTLGGGIVARMAPQDMTLTRQPDPPSSLAVTVNGQPVPADPDNGYTVSGKQVTFHGACALKDGDQVKLDYAASETHVPASPDRYVRIQAGPNAPDVIPMELTDARTSALGLDPVSALTPEAARQSLADVDSALRQVAGERSKWGAYANSLEHAGATNGQSEFSLTGALSRLEDVDVARELTEKVRQDLLVQSTAAVANQARVRPQAILDLLAAIKT